MTILPLLALALSASVALPQEPDFDRHFTGRTLRFDYHHSGTSGEEHLCLDRVRAEGDWPGSRTRLLDDTNLGKYLFEVVDPRTNRVLYSRGFASIFGEWETTGEARDGAWRSLHESLRFPEPRSPVQLVVKKRAKDGSFRELHTERVDPAHRSVDRSPIPARGTVWSLFQNGPPHEKVDLLVLGDGYTTDDMESFRADVERLMGVLFEFEPFASRRESFNVWAIDLPAGESGVTDPREGRWTNSPLGLSYNAFDSERYVLSMDNRAIREAAAQAPHDAIVMLGNSRKYGGGGIFNLWCTAAARSSQAPYLVVHELGHSFAGLGDEYYTSQVSYEEFNPPGVEPWEPNLTALLDPEHLKWRDLVAEGTPLPTPWDQKAYDDASYAYQEKRQNLREAGASEDEMEALFDEVKAITAPMLAAQRYADQVGAFEGGGYQAKGIYRPESDCIMFTRNPDRFCAVCTRGIERVIDLYAR